MIVIQKATEEGNKKNSLNLYKRYLQGKKYPKRQKYERKITTKYMHKNKNNEVYKLDEKQDKQKEAKGTTTDNKKRITNDTQNKKNIKKQSD